jgi:hypothetical protein
MRIRVLLSMQRALLDAVAPQLRGVAVSWTQGQVIARFIYDAPETEPFSETVQMVETQVVADLDDQTSTSFLLEAAPRPSPRSLRDGESWVYLRQETR